MTLIRANEYGKNRPVISEGGGCIAGSACDGCKNSPAGTDDYTDNTRRTIVYLPTESFRYQVWLEGSPTRIAWGGVLHRKTDRNALLMKSPARRILDTAACPEGFRGRKKVSDKLFPGITRSFTSFKMTFSIAYIKPCIELT